MYVWGRAVIKSHHEKAKCYQLSMGLVQALSHRLEKTQVSFLVVQKPGAMQLLETNMLLW